MVHYDLFVYLSRPICLLLILAGLFTLVASVYGALSMSTQVKENEN